MSRSIPTKRPLSLVRLLLPFALESLFLLLTYQSRPVVALPPYPTENLRNQRFLAGLYHCSFSAKHQVGAVFYSSRTAIVEGRVVQLRFTAFKADAGTTEKKDRDIKRCLWSRPTFSRARRAPPALPRPNDHNQRKEG